MQKTVDIQSLYKQIDNCETLRKGLAHIKTPYSIKDYYEKYSSVHKAEETLNNKDKEFLIKLAEHRPWLWS
jgi:hypothetical protein